MRNPTLIFPAIRRVTVPKIAPNTTYTYYKVEGIASLASSCAINV
jgi:hypothetical protein